MYVKEGVVLREGKGEGGGRGENRYEVSKRHDWYL